MNGSLILSRTSGWYFLSLAEKKLPSQYHNQSRPSSAHQQNAILMVFRWWVDSGQRMFAGWVFAYDCHLLITLPSSLDSDQAPKNARPDLDLNCLTLWWCSWKIFLKKLILKKKCTDKKRKVNPLPRRDTFKHFCKQNRPAWSGSTVCLWKY